MANQFTIGTQLSSLLPDQVKLVIQELQNVLFPTLQEINNKCDQLLRRVEKLETDVDFHNQLQTVRSDVDKLMEDRIEHLAIPKTPSAPKRLEVADSYFAQPPVAAPSG